MWVSLYIPMNYEQRLEAYVLTKSSGDVAFQIRTCRGSEKSILLLCSRKQGSLTSDLTGGCSRLEPNSPI